MLKDEGNTVDPISGNQVPPGAMQEEVRDDVPAQLSEGEFVFPADVVRYWASTSRLGVDTAYCEEVLKNGKIVTEDVEVILKRLLRLVQISSNPVLIDEN